MQQKNNQRRQNINIKGLFPFQQSLNNFQELFRVGKTKLQQIKFNFLPFTCIKYIFKKNIYVYIIFNKREVKNVQKGLFRPQFGSLLV